LEERLEADVQSDGKAAFRVEIRQPEGLGWIVKKYEDGFVTTEGGGGPNKWTMKEAMDRAMKIIEDELRRTGQLGESESVKPTVPTKKEFSKDVLRKIKGIDEQIKKLNQGRPVAEDMAINDRGASLRRLEARIANLQKEKDRLRQGPVGQKPLEQPTPKVVESVEEQADEQEEAKKDAQTKAPREGEPGVSGVSPARTQRQAPKNGPLLSSLTKMYWEMNRQLAIVCKHLKYPFQQWKWDQSEPLQRLAKEFPNLEATQWFQLHLNQMTDPKPGHPWLKIMI
jgi:hypothetical protein